jgi:hypothetical protein
MLTWFFRLLYVSGLTLVFPIVYLFAFPSDAPFPILPSLLIALLLIAISFMGLLILEERFGRALQSIAQATLIPGIIGVFFSFFSRDAVFNLLSKTFAGEQATLLLNRYLENVVPKLQIVTIVYVVLGLLIWYWGYKVNQKR